ncbi:protease [Bacillus coahuilensis p1.1.43]|uniref:Protease PrsW n=1 Tax=Bacillus coahuilensis p1.1.43 TaxID=1150625 RepID=A0A147K8W5_9BACI|nr:glutamic-type intramembrane protease PrsW [Bacillus coahuilensis]KUP06598.1 protease [Bacillus coahuilensis p1.1.43]
MFILLSAGIAPGLAFLSYLYLKDDYDKETAKNIFFAFIYGALVTFPIMFIQSVLAYEGFTFSPLTDAFIYSALLEEFFKWFILFFLIVSMIKLQDSYDGIVMGASVSLGFASAENFLYLLSNGIETAFGRALFPVSSHALIGIVMGYYIGKFASKQTNPKEIQFLFLSLFIPVFLHGSYDYLILTHLKDWPYYVLPFMFFLWWFALRKVKNAHQLMTVETLKSPYNIKEV